MNKKIFVMSLILSSCLLAGCNKTVDEKEDMFLAGYIVDITDDTVEVVSNQGNFTFDITEASVESENGINIDDTFEIYYSDELEENEITKANKLVQYFDGYFIGTVTNKDTENNEFTLTSSDGVSYIFKMPENINTTVGLLNEELIYEVEFNKKIVSGVANEITALNILEVDDAPNEELELIETFNGTMVD